MNTDISENSGSWYLLGTVDGVRLNWTNICQGLLNLGIRPLKIWHRLGKDEMFMELPSSLYKPEMFQKTLSYLTGQISFVTATAGDVAVYKAFPHRTFCTQWFHTGGRCHFDRACNGIHGNDPTVNQRFDLMYQNLLHKNDREITTQKSDYKEINCPPDTPIDYLAIRNVLWQRFFVIHFSVLADLDVGCIPLELAAASWYIEPHPFTSSGEAVEISEVFHITGVISLLEVMSIRDPTSVILPTPAIVSSLRLKLEALANFVNPTRGDASQVIMFAKRPSVAKSCLQTLAKITDSPVPNYTIRPIEEALELCCRVREQKKLQFSIVSDAFWLSEPSFTAVLQRMGKCDFHELQDANGSPKNCALTMCRFMRDVLRMGHAGVLASTLGNF